MTAYLVMCIEITHADRWTRYRDAVLPLIQRFGGSHVSQADRVERLETAHEELRMAMFAFPSSEQLRAFWTSPEYEPIKALREGAATLDAWAVSTGAG